MARVMDDDLDRPRVGAPALGGLRIKIAGVSLGFILCFVQVFSLTFLVEIFEEAVH
jgi:hypothetical protein